MRNQNRQTQLQWSDPQDMHWEDLPASVRDQLREALGVLLRHVAAQAAPREEPCHAA